MAIGLPNAVNHLLDLFTHHRGMTCTIAGGLLYGTGSNGLAGVGGQPLLAIGTEVKDGAALTGRIAEETTALPMQH